MLAESGGGEWNRAVLLEQRNVSWKKDLMAKMIKGGQVVLHSYGGTFLVAKACMTLSKQQQFVGCKIDSVCFNIWLPSVVEKFVQQVLDEDADSKGSVEVVSFGQTYVSAMYRVSARRKSLMLDAPAGLRLTYSFPGHVVDFLSNCFKNFSLFEMGKHITVMKWSERRW